MHLKVIESFVTFNAIQNESTTYFNFFLWISFGFQHTNWSVYRQRRGRTIFAGSFIIDAAQIFLSWHFQIKALQRKLNDAFAHLLNVNRTMIMAITMYKIYGTLVYFICTNRSITQKVICNSYNLIICISFDDMSAALIETEYFPSSWPIYPRKFHACRT